MYAFTSAIYLVVSEMNVRYILHFFSVVLSLHYATKFFYIPCWTLLSTDLRIGSTFLVTLRQLWETWKGFKCSVRCNVALQSSDDYMEFTIVSPPRKWPMKCQDEHSQVVYRQYIRIKSTIIFGVSGASQSYFFNVQSPKIHRLGISTLAAISSDWLNYNFGDLQNERIDN